MAGQGKITIAVASELEREGWAVAYTCIPITPHVGAVAIPTKQGISRQRYPDIVASDGDAVALIEVGISLNERVTGDIVERFNEMCAALSSRDNYTMWTAAIARECGITLPEIFRPVCVLVLTKTWSGEGRVYVDHLKAMGISVCDSESFSAKALNGC